MSLTRTLAIMRKETIQVRRDARSLLIVLAMPVMLMALLGYGINLDQAHVPLCVFDREGSQQSQALLQLFRSNKYFDLVLNAGSYTQVAGALDRGRCAMAIVIPNDFSKDLDRGALVTVQALVDATDNNTANLIIGYAQQIVAGYSANLQATYFAQQGREFDLQPLTVEARAWFNEELESRNFVVPGVIAIVMAVIGTFLTSLTIAREWERGTMEQLISTPVTALEVVTGKLVPYFVIGMFDAGVCAVLAVWWFEVPFRGSVALMLAASALFLLVVLVLGILISVLTRNQLAASQFSLIITFLPAFLLSGFAFPIDQMPLVLRLITYLIPARYYVSILKSVFLKGTGFAVAAGPLAAMAVFTLLTALLTIRSFRKTLI